MSLHVFPILISYLTELDKLSQILRPASLDDVLTDSAQTFRIIINVA